MPLCKCALCGGPKSWEWQEAFYKEGFDNGANSQTEAVINVLKDAGYTTDTNDASGKEFIDSIKSADGVELISEHTWDGEIDPRTFLPREILDLLNNASLGDEPAVFTAAVPMPFAIDSDKSDEQRLVVNIANTCTVVIGRNVDGDALELNVRRGGNTVVRRAVTVEQLYAYDAYHNPTYPHRIMAEFVPQVWMGDIAMSVDPLGDTAFDCTDAVLALGIEAAKALRDDQTETDHLRHEPTAPAWIRDWSGPFRVEVEESIAAFFEAVVSKA